MKKVNGCYIGMYVIVFIFGAVEWITWMTGSGCDDVFNRHIVQAQEVCEDNGGLCKIEGEGN